MEQLFGPGSDYHAVSAMAWAVLEGLYDNQQLAALRASAKRFEVRADSRFLDLTMLRGAHRLIPQASEIMFDRKRLHLLSEVAGTTLEPYPIDIAACHLNYYAGGKLPLAFHSDGPAMVELIPLDSHSVPGAGTLVFKGLRDEGLGILEASGSAGIPSDRIVRIPHLPGQSILLQGRRLLHSGAIVDNDRMLLVFALRAKNEPWKDDNTITRLAMDYSPSEFLDDWIQDELECKLPALRKAQASDD